MTLLTGGTILVTGPRWIAVASAARRASFAVVAVLGVASVQGCALSGAEDATVGPTTADVSSFDEQLYWAERDPDVTSAQREALRSAASDDEMSYGELEALFEDAYRCLDAAGIDHQRQPDWEDVPGFKVPNFSYGNPIEVADECLRTTIDYAFEAYQSQPRALEMSDAAFESERDAVIECLRGRGFEVDDEATTDELRRADAESVVGGAGAGDENPFCSRFP